MNPASRLHEIVVKMQKYPNNKRKLYEVYKEIFEADSVFDLFNKLHLIQKEVSRLNALFIQSNKIDKYKDLITLLERISAPTNLDISFPNIISVVNAVEPKLLVLSDALEMTHLEELDVGDELRSMQKDLDSFLDGIKDLDLDNDTKTIYVNVTFKLKESIELYNIGGLAGVKEALRVFECITKDTEKSKDIVDKLHSVVDKSSKIQDLIGFGVDAIKYITG